MDGQEPDEGSRRTFTTGAAELSLTIDHLAPGTEYRVSVQTSSDHGNSAASRITFRSLGTPAAPVVQVI